jgi:hypothetical protein
MGPAVVHLLLVCSPWHLAIGSLECNGLHGPVRLVRFCRAQGYGDAYNRSVAFPLTFCNQKQLFLGTHQVLIFQWLWSGLRLWTASIRYGSKCSPSEFMPGAHLHLRPGLVLGVAACALTSQR